MKISYLLIASAFAGLVILVGQAYGQSQAPIGINEQVNTILDYCYQHADRSNPVQDLVNKSLVSADFKRDTCAAVKEGYNNTQEPISIISSYDPDYQRYLLSQYCKNPAYARFIDLC